MLQSKVTAGLGVSKASSGQWRTLKFPETREGSFKPFFIALGMGEDDCKKVLGSWIVVPREKALYPEVTKSWESGLLYLMTYLGYPEELGSSIYTTNIPERLTKSELNERYKRGLFRIWDRTSEKLQSIRTVKYGNKAMVDAFSLAKIVDTMALEEHFLTAEPTSLFIKPV